MTGSVRVAARSAALLAIAVLLAATAPAPATAKPFRTPVTLHYSPGQIVVIADDGALDASTTGAAHAANPALAASLSRFGLERARRLDPATPRGVARRARIWKLTSNRPDFDPVAASRALMATGAVRAASPNYRLGVFSTVPNDIYVIYQWYIENGDSATISLPLAWDLEKGDSSTTIAIIDTGVDIGHPDLASQIWHNPDEIPGNGIDDDGNGLIDDTEGWDFGAGDNDPSPEYTPDPSGIDVGFHGTFCAGIADAATNNEEGIAGAGWNCRIMPLKAANPDSGLTTEAVASAIAYAADKHASVISMSFGAHGDPGVPELFQALVDMATEAGALCVAAAGNDGDSLRTYPAACDHVLSVGATDYTNARASFSNYGSWVDVAAPGSLMWSTICRNYTFTSIDQFYYLFLFSWDGVNPYMYGDGTSFACPLVGGVCALVRHRFPSLTPDLVIQHVIETGDALPFDEPIGTKVNAYNAVSMTPTAVATTEAPPARLRVAAVPNPVAGAGAIRFDLPAAGHARVAVFDAAGRLVRVLMDGPLTAGPHAIAWDGRDDRGSRLPSGVYFARVQAAGKSQSAKVVLFGR
ncbi:MAG: S8 family serine peptidase [Hyphomicrobiales bacterium]